MYILESIGKLQDMKYDHNSPTIIYNEGNSHLVAASIMFANFTFSPIRNIAVCKYDMASFDDVVDEGYVNRKFEQVLPNQYIVIDQLTSFCLEFICYYTITFLLYEGGTREIKFKLDKYGKFESVAKDVFFEMLGVQGSIIKIETTESTN